MTRRLLALAPAMLTLAAVGCNNCPTYALPVTAGTVSAPEITEASGLAVSQLDPSVLWVHNDSGDSARLFAIGTDGGHRGTFPLVGASASDWEDMAIGPGPAAGVPYLYVGDIGDNGESRSTIQVYRVPEPAVPATPGSYPVTGAERLELAYADGPHNAETLLVDPANGDLYIVTKPATAGTASKVFRAAAPISAASTTTLTEVASLVFGQGSLPGGAQPTGGDIDAGRNYVAIRTYTSAFAFCFTAEATVAETLTTSPCSVPLLLEPQGESFAFDADGSSYYSLSEFANQPLHRADRTSAP